MPRHCKGTLLSVTHLLLNYYVYMYIYTFFINVYITLSPTLVCNWCIYFMTKKAEELKAVFSDVSSIFEQLDFHSNSGHMERCEVS